MDSGSVVGSSLLNHALGAFIADAPRPGTKVADLFAPSGVLTWLCFVCLARPRTTSCSSCGVDLVPTCSADVRPGISCQMILSFVHRPLLSFLRHSRHCAVCALAYTYISLIFAARRRRLCFAGCTISLLAFCILGLARRWLSQSPRYHNLIVSLASPLALSCYIRLEAADLDIWVQTGDFVVSPLLHRRPHCYFSVRMRFFIGHHSFLQRSRWSSRALDRVPA